MTEKRDLIKGSQTEAFLSVIFFKTYKQAFIGILRYKPDINPINWIEEISKINRFYFAENTKLVPSVYLFVSPKYRFDPEMTIPVRSPGVLVNKK